MALAIDIAVEFKAWDDVDDIDGLARRALDAVMGELSADCGPGTELSLVLCDDPFIRRLNRDWRGKDQPTNVLSFPADPCARAMTLGDIVIAYETTAREAAEEGKRIHDHLAHLIVHGALHLLGYDHESDAEAETMERLEVRALMRLGIRSPYDDPMAEPMHLQGAP